MDSQQFLLDRLWYKSPILVKGNQERGLIEQLSKRLIDSIDFSHLDRNRILVAAYDFLQFVRQGNNEVVSNGQKQNNIRLSEEQIRLLLALLDGGLAILEQVEKYRLSTIQLLILQLESQNTTLQELDIVQKDKRDSEWEEMRAEVIEVIEEIQSDIALLQAQTVTAIREKIAIFDKNFDESNRRAAPLETAFVRDFLGAHPQKDWPLLREQLVTMFDLSPHAIAASKAWKAETLQQKGGKSFDEILETAREQYQASLQTIEKSPSQSQASRKKRNKDTDVPETSVEMVTLDTIYQFLDQADADFARSKEPVSFILNEQGKLTLEQGNWVLTLGALISLEKRPTLNRLLATFFGLPSPHRIGGLIAYLHPSFSGIIGENIRNCLNDVAVYQQSKVNTHEEIPISLSLNNRREQSFSSKVDHAETVVEDLEDFDSLNQSILSQVSISVESDGVDYDNEIKNKWRSKIREFIEKHTNLSIRQKMKLLCFPGESCHEAKLYIDMGFKPENIWGIENCSQAKEAEFLKNADSFKINSYIGEMEDFLLQNDTAFDLVSLDFNGYFSQKVNRIIRLIKLSEKALFLLNILGKREHDIGKMYIQLTAAENHPEVYKITSGLHRQGYNEQEIYQVIQKMVENGRFDKNIFDLSESTRDSALIDIIYPHVGMFRLNESPMWKHIRQMPEFCVKKHFGLRAEVTDALYVIERRQDVFIETIKTVFQSLKLTSSKEQADLLVGSMGMIFNPALRQGTLVNHHESYKYISPFNNSPYFSDFAVLVTPRSEYAELRHTILFLLKSLGFTIRCFEDKKVDSLGIRVASKDGILIKKIDSLSGFSEGHMLPVLKSSLLQTLVNDSVVCEIRLSKFQEDLLSIGKILRKYCKYPVCKPERQLIE